MLTESLAEGDPGVADDEIVVGGIPADLEAVGVFGIGGIGEGDGVLGLVIFFGV